MKHAAILCGAAILAGLPAAAQSDLYINAGGALYDAGDARVNAVTLRGGIAFHDVLGAEFEASFGLGAENVDGTDIELESQFGGFIISRYRFLPKLDALARIGVVKGEFQSSNNGVSRDSDANGVAFGFGGEYQLTQTLGLRLDYTRINGNEEDFDGGVNVFAVTGVYTFGSVR